MGPSSFLWRDVVGREGDYSSWVILVGMQRGMGGLPGFAGVGLENGFHCFKLREMLSHVGVKNHLDDEIAELAEVCLLHVRKDVTVVLLDQSECCKK